MQAKGLAAALANWGAPALPEPPEAVAQIEEKITELGRDVKIEPDFDLERLLGDDETPESVGDDVLRRRLRLILGLIVLWQVLFVCWEFTGQVSRSPGQANSMETAADYLNSMKNALDITMAFGAYVWPRRNRHD